MFSVNQKVILPESHNNLEGVVVVVPKQLTQQTGLTQQLGRVKVSYMSGIGMTEAWFKNEVLEVWKEPKDITASLKAIHQLELEKIAKENEREKLSWIENAGSSEDTKVNVERMKAKLEDGEIIEVNKNTDIVKEMAKSSEQVQAKLIKLNDNSDVYGG